jgi:hypothetical protein
MDVDIYTGADCDISKFKSRYIEEKKLTFVMGEGGVIT